MDVWEVESGKEGMKLSDGTLGVAHIQPLNGGGNFQFALKHHSRLDRKDEQESTMAVCVSSVKYQPLEELMFLNSDIHKTHHQFLWKYTKSN